MCGTTVDTQGTKMSDACNKVSIETSLDLSSSPGPRFVFYIWSQIFFILWSQICVHYFVEDLSSVFDHIFCLIISLVGVDERTTAPILVLCVFRK